VVQVWQLEDMLQDSATAAEVLAALGGIGA
jgi:hypothetical protein